MAMRTIDFSLSCNWDRDLIPLAKKHEVTEMFGKLHSDVVGGGRPSMMLPTISKRVAARFIRDVVASGMQFNYLLNGSCMGLREHTRTGQRKLHDLIDWAYDAGARSFTVSIPLLASKIKHLYPNAHLTVSMMNRVESVEAARYWEDLGAEVLVLFDNKDFRLIRALKEQTNLKVEVTANLSCMNRCFQSTYHGASDSLSSNRSSGLGEFFVPVCDIRCHYYKISETRRIVAGQWIRPEDLHHYESLGVDRLKVLDRLSTTQQLSRILKAYRSGRYDGNLADLIPGYQKERFEKHLSLSKIPRLAAAFLRPDRYNLFRVFDFWRRTRNPEIFIDGSALEGHIEGMMQRDCRHLSCAKCGWCDKYARDAIRIDQDERELYLSNARKNQEDLDSGRFFFYWPHRTKARPAINSAGTAACSDRDT